MTENNNESLATEIPVEKTDLAEVVAEITTDQPAAKKQRIILHPDNLVTIDQREYRLVEDYRNGFDIEQINERYSDVLNRYDYIVGDIGFEQLRLKGFFADEQKKMPLDTRIGALQDYLYEYCNFGCAYFVLERLGPIEPQTQKPRSNQQRNRRNNNRKNKGQQGAPQKQTAHVTEKQSNRGKGPSTPKKKPVIKNRREGEVKDVKRETKPAAKKPETTGKRNFTIRQTDNETKGE